MKGQIERNKRAKKICLTMRLNQISEKNENDGEGDAVKGELSENRKKQEDKPVLEETLPFKFNKL